jgi:acyl-CoA-binding protein
MAGHWRPTMNREQAQQAYVQLVERLAAEDRR